MSQALKRSRQELSDDDDGDDIVPTAATLAKRQPSSSVSTGSSGARASPNFGSPPPNTAEWEDETAVLELLAKQEFDDDADELLSLLANQTEPTLAEAELWLLAVSSLYTTGNSVLHPHEVIHSLSAIQSLPIFSTKRLRKVLQSVSLQPGHAEILQTPEITISDTGIRRVVAAAWWSPELYAFDVSDRTRYHAIMDTLKTTPTHLNADPRLASKIFDNPAYLKKIENSVKNALNDKRGNTKSEIWKSLRYVEDGDKIELATSLLDLGNKLWNGSGIVPVASHWVFIALLRYWSTSGKIPLKAYNEAKFRWEYTNNYWEEVDGMLAKIKDALAAGGVRRAKWIERLQIAL